ncbi:acyl-peptide hydrolase [Sphaerisporangium krabiense]|uniref:Dipeptidyl aminopeptidase/acylaminoacyl peptidase n=1 Tax=Sphaerisporangium krabiense TaxID=763782 RepID=A0A7W8Z794_9ACTN|nr:prolyl oligopeptidase family serine peptidase [Sphaerisporangium krabiense]MBB5628682.1 dipeptidyl aminopeptidase/acylaminoacyl peptidase [Sphaerisporangium krabiense]GII60478.1 acyl-peptide hydrolase [Sphaerisporangium krabiense]
MPPERTSGRPTPPFGGRPSPISTSDVVRSGVRPGYPTVLGDDLWWEEDRPTEGGRRTIVHRAPCGALRELLPAPWDARTRVHEYGGRSHVIVPGGDVVFAHHADQRLYVLPAGTATPRPITPEPGVPCGLRYADLTVHDGEVWCVMEHHTGDGEVTRSIVSIPLDGGAVRRRVAGGDFYASPVVSPDGAHLAYVRWDHPRMPWVGTELRVTRTSDGASWRVAGGPEESVLSPRWDGPGGLYLLSDRSGWWNLERVSLDGGVSRLLCPAEEEFGWAPYELGGAPYAVLADGRLAVLHGRGDLRLAVLDPRTGALEEPGLPYAGWLPCLSADGSVVCGVAYAPAVPRSVVRLDTATGASHCVRGDIPVPPDPAHLPAPRPVEIPGRAGRRVHAFLYPPAGEVAGPYVVFAHDGPTTHSVTAPDLHKAFLTSRGIGVLDVNYGGSTGYGRAYRERLRGRWGVVDVEDVIAAAEWLVTEGLADPARVAVRGAGAGGWTSLAACCASGLFRGCVSIAGVTALAPLAAATHDFESRYVEWLVGPDSPGLYATREPLSRAGEIDCPVLLMQGQDDPLVPPAQAEAFVAALTERGVPCTYLSFEGETHVFRRAETKGAALAAELSFYRQIFG